MIILPSHKLCIITPPHTASRHLHKALCNPAIGGLYTLGPNPDNVIDHHFTQICSEYHDYKRVLVVRNPFGRATGLYRHYLWACEHMPETVKALGIAWDQFANYLAIDHFNKLDWLYRYTITRLINNTYYDHIIKYENLSSELNMLLGLEVEIPPKYEDSPVEYEEYYKDQQIRSWIFTWGYPDFWRYYPESLC